MAALYADEDFDIDVVKELRQLGNDVVTVQERKRKGASDQQVLTDAIAEDRAVLTFNRRHFIRLHSRTSQHKGLVVCSRDPDSAALAARIQMSLNILTSLENQLVRVNRR